jgi:hypothetical protein
LGEAVTEEQRLELIRRLLEFRDSTRTLIEAVDGTVELWKSSGGMGVAFAAIMLREAMECYSHALSKFAKKLMEED